MTPCTCIDDTNRPSDIPTTHWVVKGNTYHITQTDKCLMQGGAVGVKLAEIDLTPFHPWQYFAARRFAPLEEIGTTKEITEKIAYL